MLVVLCLTTCQEGCGCNNNELNSLPPFRITTGIIKFKQTEYKEYVMAYFSTREGCALSLESYYFQPLSSLILYGQSPYIELADDYLLIDWKWFPVYWVDNEAIINKKWTEWTELKSRDICLPIEDLYVSYPVMELYSIDPCKIKEYNSGYLKYDIPEYIGIFSERTWACMKKQQRERILLRTVEIDNAFVEYAEILTRMINEGSLDKYGIKVELSKLLMPFGQVKKY